MEYSGAVYKPPIDDEEQRASREANSTPPIYPRQRAQARKAPGKPRKTFYSDEHPEIPKVRRASLKQARVDTPPLRDHSLHDDLADTPRQSELTPQPRLRAKQKRAAQPPLHKPDTSRNPRSARDEAEFQPRAAVKRKHAEMLPFTGLEDLDESPDDTARFSPAASRSQATRARSEQATRTRPISRPTPGTHRRHTGHARGRLPGRRQTWLLIGLLALLLLVLAPLLAGIVNRLASQPHAMIDSNTSAQISLAKLQTVPTNPHELVIVPPDTTHPAPPVLASSAYLLDTDSEATVYAQNPYLHLPMLSTTKLMTATLAVEMGKLDQKITVTQAMEGDISHLSPDSAIFGVKLGETYTLRDLLYGLLYVSGNDAALVIADALAGNVPAFVAAMNQKAQELGLHDTHFVNPHGLLDSGQYSCARDLAVLGQYSLSIPVIQRIDDGRSFQIAAGGNHDVRIVLNENQFLWWYPNVTGGKTGYDGASDFVQVMQVTRNNRHMIGVVMHTNNWWTDMRDLIDYGANDYTWTSPRDVENAGQPIPYDNLWDYFAKDTQDSSVPTADGGLYYIYSGYSVSGPILAYFKQKGGLKTFGYPLKLPVPSGGTSLSQQFQHGVILCNLSTNQCHNA